VFARFGKRRIRSTAPYRLLVVYKFLFWAKPCLECRHVHVFKPQLSQPENLATLKESVTRALIDAEKNIILESQCLGSILWLTVALGVIALGLRALERELYMRFIYLPVDPSIAGKGKRRRNEYIKESRKRRF